MYMTVSYLGMFRRKDAQLHLRRMEVRLQPAGLRQVRDDLQHHH